MSEGISEASAAKKRKLGQRFRPEYCIEFSCRMKSTQEHYAYTTELGQKTARCESLRALLPYVEWDRFVTLAGSKSRLRVTLSYLVFVESCKDKYI
jgi:hypothetical protein